MPKSKTQLKTVQGLSQDLVAGRGRLDCGNMMVPWDIYLPTPSALRYFGDPGPYADLFAFVQEHAGMLEELGPSAPFDRHSRTDSKSSAQEGERRPAVSVPNGQPAVPRSGAPRLTV